MTDQIIITGVTRNEFRIFQLCLVIMLVLIGINAFIVRRHKEIEKHLREVVRQQDDTIKLQRHAIVELENMLAQQKAKEPQRWN